MSALADVATRHGTAGSYGRGCRCAACTEAKRLWARHASVRRRALRVRVGGRLVSTARVEHGRGSTYRNWHCRCEPCCRAEHDERVRRRERNRRNDRLIAQLTITRLGEAGDSDSDSDNDDRAGAPRDD